MLNMHTLSMRHVGVCLTSTAFVAEAGAASVGPEADGIYLTCTEVVADACGASVGPEADRKWLIPPVLGAAMESTFQILALVLWTGLIWTGQQVIIYLCCSVFSLLFGICTNNHTLAERTTTSSVVQAG